MVYNVNSITLQRTWSNLSNSIPNGSYTMTHSNLFLSPYKILLIAPENKYSLWKQAYSNILKISPPKTENFPIQNSHIFHISAQSLDYGYSLEPPNEYPQSMFLSRNKKNNAYPCKPQFCYIKVGFKGSKLYRLFRDVWIFFCLFSHEIVCCVYSLEAILMSAKPLLCRRLKIFP